MNDLRKIDSDLPTLRDENLTNILWKANQIYDDKTNQTILMHVMWYIKDSQRFGESLFKPSVSVFSFRHTYYIRLFYQVFNFY